MASNLFSFTSSFDFHGIEGSHNPILDDHHKEEPGLDQKQNQMLSVDDLGEISPLCSGLLKEMPKLKSFQSWGQEMPQPLALSSLELLRYYAGGFKKLKGNMSNHTTNESNAVGGSKKLSTEDILRVAGARYVHFSDQKYDDISNIMHPFGYALSGLSEEETKDVELVHLLLAAAEKAGYQQFERAKRFLSRCEWSAAERANPVQRIVFYFAAALREKIDKETGNFVTKEFWGNELNLTNHGLSYNTTSLACYQRLPFNQVMYLTGIQAVVENIGNTSKIHILDFEIRSGVQWISLMQALADCEQHPIQLLKITAIAFNNKEKVEETGQNLAGFAESLNLPFQFNVVCVSCYLEIKEDLFKIKNSETLIVYCALILRIMISYPKCLENLLGVIKKLNPSLMVVIEVEANHNSPSFVNRFIEALFFYSTYFDALETCLDNDTETRTMMEAVFDYGIRNIVAMEGTERTVRSVKIDVWRAFFSRFRMVEVGLSDRSLYQANLVLKQFPCASTCTLDKNGKSLIIGWKGTPIHSVSVWKFSRERGKALTCSNKFR